MNEFGVIAGDEALEYIQLIASRMVDRHGISRDEAVARIRSFWDGLAFVTEDQLIALLHREADSWADIIHSRTESPTAT